MGIKLSKKLRPAFLASALVLTGAPATAMAQDTGSDQGVTIVLKEDQKTEANDNKAQVAENANAKKKPLYEMDFGELLKEKNNDHVKAWEHYEFYQLRRIELNSAVRRESVDKLITEIEILNSIDSTKPITLMIDSGGGSVYDGLRLINAMKASKAPVHTYVNGLAASMAAVILISGDEREATPQSRVMIHQVSAGTSGKVDDMEHGLNHVNNLQDDLFEIIAQNSGLKMEDVRRLAAKDIFFDGDESLRLGFIDKVIEGKPGRDIKPGSRDVPEEYYPENRVRSYYTKSFAPKR